MVMRMGKTETRRFYGNCLEAIGFPDGGTALVDLETAPRLYDVVWCTNPAGSVSGYFKELVDVGNSESGRRPMVQTRFNDHKKNFAFWPVEIYGVVLEARDKAGNLAWKRPQPADYAEVVRCGRCLHAAACRERGQYKGDNGFCSEGKQG